MMRPRSAFVISLDFELQWGLRAGAGRTTIDRPKLLGARAAIPRLLELFADFEIAATWATVGFLFARSRADLKRHRPYILPRYQDSGLDPYDEPVGADERSDPWHFAPTLIEQILLTPGQEVATHTFSHYYCSEAGQTADTFRADLEAAQAIAADWSIELRSIVFPRNQHNAAYDDVLKAAGIIAYRGNPDSWMWRFTGTREGATITKRAARFADAYIPLTGSGRVDWAEIPQPSGLADVRASSFLRPYSPALRQLEAWRLDRLCRALRNTAELGGVFHLWWHPHNFGTNPRASLDALRHILREFDWCRAHHGMASISMMHAAERAGSATMLHRLEREERAQGAEDSRTT